MAIFKCKMCGGDLEVTEGMKVCECEYCGTRQTIPASDSEKKINLFNRANRLRFANEFDKASGIFESIIAEFPEESEAYWGLCLCKYGIEYVDDPVTAKKVPTCHRTAYDSIFEDNNFDLALEYADTESIRIYREEAKEIDRLQKRILEIARNEKPFDVFICYKETDENGQRTKDSVLAQDMYDTLTDKGYRVFFARITLEDKLGKEFEPYIFSALNTAKVMLAIGTKYEYFNAVWVKNEWLRFLDMMKEDKTRTLIPCYCDIDAYDMPPEFKNLQGQDMSKIGFMQDLVRGIQKLIGSTEKGVSSSENEAMQNAGTNIVPLLDRSFLCIEDGEFEKADELLEQVLNLNPREPKAYIGKLLCELKLKKEEDIAHLDKPLWSYTNYNKAIRFAEAAYVAKIQAYNEVVIESIKNKIRTTDEKLSSLSADLTQKKEEFDVASNRIKEIEKQIEEYKYKREEIKKRIIEELEKEYTQLSEEKRQLFEDMNSSENIFQRAKYRIKNQAINEQIIYRLAQINEKIRDVKQNRIEDSLGEECNKIIPQLENEKHKESRAISPIQSKIFALNQEISDLKNEKERLNAMLEYKE